MNNDKTIESMTPDPMNPRAISKQAFAQLKSMLDKFGDLSGVVENQQTNQLVGGHMRVRAFQELGANPNVQITQRFEVPTRNGTLAIGYVLLNGEPFTYRLVDWSKTKQAAANLAANKAGELANWDNDLLAEVMHDIQTNDEALLKLTGFDDKEIEKLMKDSGAVETDDDETPPDDGKMIFKLTDDQRRVVEQAIDHIKRTREIPTTDFDAKNGSALFYMAEAYLSEAPALTPEQDPSNFTPPEIPVI